MLLSIITVTLNSSSVLDGLLNSMTIIANRKDIEFIFIDGESVDDTLEKLNSFQALNKRILSENDDGIYDAMNKGIKLSSGSYVYFINSDDKIIESGFQEAISIISQRKPKPTVFMFNVLIDGWGKTWCADASKLTCHQGIIFPRSGLLYDTRYKIYADGRYIRCHLDVFQVDYVGIYIARFKLGGVSNSAITIAKIRELAKISKFKLIKALCLWMLQKSIGEKYSRQLVYLLKGIARYNEQ